MDDMCWVSGKESTYQCRRHRFDPWIRKIHWRRKWQATPIFLPGKSYGQKSLMGYSPQGCKELDTTERLTLSYEIAQGYSKIASKNTEGTNVTKTALKKNKLGDFFYHISRFLYHYEVKTVWQCHKDRKWDLWRSLESPCIYVERHHCWPIRNEWSFQYMVLD